MNTSIKIYIALVLAALILAIVFRLAPTATKKQSGMYNQGSLTGLQQEVLGK